MGKVMDVEARYKSLQERSFKQLLRYKTFEGYVEGASYSEGSMKSVHLDGFIAESKTEAEFSSLYQNMGRIRAFNGDMRQYVFDNKIEIKTYKKKYFNWFAKNVLSCNALEDYLRKHGMKCDYCGISEDEISSLIDCGEIKTKRLYSRGKTMEIDRGEPNGEYSLENIILSCYWCNNAKTDEFTYAEFMEIAKGFSEVWKSRLGEAQD